MHRPSGDAGPLPVSATVLVRVDGSSEHVGARRANQCAPRQRTTTSVFACQSARRSPSRYSRPYGRPRSACERSIDVRRLATAAAASAGGDAARSERARERVGRVVHAGLHAQRGLRSARSRRRRSRAGSSIVPRRASVVAARGSIASACRTAPRPRRSGPRRRTCRAVVCVDEPVAVRHRERAVEERVIVPPAGERDRRVAPPNGRRRAEQQGRRRRRIRGRRGRAWTSAPDGPDEPPRARRATGDT